MDLTPADVDALRAAGRDPAEVDRQLALLRGPAPRARLVAPCTIGRGITPWSPERFAGLEARADAARGRVTAFVPASGAASRLFAEVVQKRGAAPVVARARELAAWGEIAAALARAGVDPATASAEPIAAAMLEGADLAALPKGLLPFHVAPDGVRTAFDEHVAEARALGVQRLHFTVSTEHRARFEAKAKRYDVDIGFSVQDPATDTVAIEASGALLRDDDGIVFRPGGHGALLRNLAGLTGDVVLVKNIDNIVPDAHRAEVVAWRRRLLGALVDLEGRVHAALDALDAGESEPASVLVAELDGQAPAPIDALRERLDRPIRVAAMVVNDGQPGGGPFFVAGRRTPQIVESAQVDLGDPEQKAIWSASTHFNPVDLALSVRDRHGRPFDLSRFADPGAAMVTAKTHAGRPITVLELPGLWNGQMARWTTVFVEIPRACFQPVKTLADLLGPGHHA